LWKEVVVALFGALTQGLPRGMEENHKEQPHITCFKRDLNQAPAEYKSEALQYEPTCKVLPLADITIYVLGNSWFWPQDMKLNMLA
jgi:hypothetical protein